MRVQEINGVRTPIVDEVVVTVFEQIVANFRVLTGEETLEFDTAEQARQAMESLPEVVPVLQQRTGNRWLVIQPNQLPISSIGQVVDLSVPVQVSTAPVQVVEVAKPVEVVVPKPRPAKAKVADFDLDYADSTVELSGPAARVLNDVIFALLDDSFADLDTEDSQIALALMDEIVAEEGTLELVITLALDSALFGTEVEMTSTQHEVAEYASSALSEHVG